MTFPGGRAGLSGGVRWLARMATIASGRNEPGSCEYRHGIYLRHPEAAYVRPGGNAQASRHIADQGTRCAAIANMTSQSWSELKARHRNEPASWTN